MEMHALDAFCRIADHGSLTRAAAALGVAQSVLSRRISTLEAELGGRLFYRTGRGVVLTELGMRLQPRARNVVAEAEALREEARGERTSPSGVVELGLVPATARPLVTLLYMRLRDDFPRIRLRATEAYSGQVEEWLATGRIDVGLFNRYGRGSVRDASLMVTSDIALVAPRGRQTSRGAEIPFRALQDRPLLLPPSPNALVATIRDLAVRQGIDLNIALEAASAPLVRDAVLVAGLCTLAPMHLARRDYGEAAFVISRVVKPAIHQRTWLALSTQRPVTVAARAVAHLLGELAPQLTHPAK